MRVLVPFGTRPEIVKLAPVVAAHPRGRGTTWSRSRRVSTTTRSSSDTFFADLALEPDVRHDVAGRRGGPHRCAPVARLRRPGRRGVRPGARARRHEHRPRVRARGSPVRRAGRAPRGRPPLVQPAVARGGQPARRRRGRVPPARTDRARGAGSCSTRASHRSGSRSSATRSPTCSGVSPRPVTNRARVAGIVVTAHRATNVDVPERLRASRRARAAAVRRVRTRCASPSIRARGPDWTSAGALAELHAIDGLVLEPPLRFAEMLEAVARGPHRRHRLRRPAGGGFVVRRARASSFARRPRDGKASSQARPHWWGSTWSAPSRWHASSPPSKRRSAPGTCRVPTATVTSGRASLALCTMPTPTGCSVSSSPSSTRECPRRSSTRSQHDAPGPRDRRGVLRPGRHALSAGGVARRRMGAVAARAATDGDRLAGDAAPPWTSPQRKVRTGATSSTERSLHSAPRPTASDVLVRTFRGVRPLHAHALPGRRARARTPVQTGPARPDLRRRPRDPARQAGGPRLRRSVLGDRRGATSTAASTASPIRSPSGVAVESPRRRARVDRLRRGPPGEGRRRRVACRPRARSACARASGRRHRMIRGPGPSLPTAADAIDLVERDARAQTVSTPTSSRNSTSPGTRR